MNNKKNYWTSSVDALSALDKTNKRSYTKDAFLEGFNSVGTTKKSENAIDVFYEKQSKIKTLPIYPSSQKATLDKLPYNLNKPTTPVQYAPEKTSAQWKSPLNNLNSNTNIGKHYGFAGVYRDAQTKSQNPDAIEFGEDSETYKILQDLSNRWSATSDSAEKDRLHAVAEDVRRLSRGNNRVKYGTDEIFDVMHKNAKLGQLVRAGSLGTIPIKSLLANPLLAGVSGTLLEPSAFLIAMTDYGPWDYKWKDKWRVGGEEGKNLKFYDGKNLDEGNRRNWLPWIYFDGYLIGADKFGNMNMAYVGRKMGLPEKVYKNSTTMDDPEDIFWIDKGTAYANSGR